MFSTIPVYVNGPDHWICAKCQSQIAEIKDIYTLDIAEAWHNTCQAYPDIVIIIVCMACKRAES